MPGGGLDPLRHAALFEAMPVGVVLVDGSRTILACNTAYCRVLDRPAEELVGRFAGSLITPGADSVGEGIEALVTGRSERFTTETSYRRPDGSTVWARLTASVVSREEDLYVAVIEDLSELDEAERKLQERTALLNHAQQIGGVGSWAWYPLTDHNEWSPQARRIYGLTDEQAATGDANLFFDAIHPDDREEVMKHVWDAFRAGAPMTAEFRIRRRDGERWVREQADVERDAEGNPERMVGVAIDITDRKAVENDLREKTAMLERAHELAKLGTFTVDLTSRRVNCSRELARLVGGDDAFTMGVEEFRDKIVGAEERDSWAEQLDTAYRRGGSFSFEHRVQTLGPSPRWFRVHGSVDVDDLGVPLRAVGVIQDVTEQRLLEHQVRQTQKMQAVGQLASGVAHDFNNLLLVIGGNAQLALASGADVEQEMSEILHASQSAGDLVRRLLAFSRDSASQPRNVSVNDVVRDVRRMIERLIETTVEIETDLTDGDTTVFTDPARLEQALLNLAVNARDAMPRGGHLVIRTAVTNGSVILRVTDTGTGMDDETRERIFEPFFTTKPPGAGTGLGLATVYGAVAEAGGDIAVESKVGRGTTFTIALPRTEQDVEGAPSGSTAGPVRGDGERILVVEDDPMVRAISTELLTRAGYEIDAAEDGLDAIRLLETGAEYDLVVSDVMMPRMTGLQLAEELERRGIDLPIVFTSGYTERHPVLASPDRSRFVAKPFSGEQVTAAVSELLRSCRSSRSR
jgi:PAS domain S-box-containing protein